MLPSFSIDTLGQSVISIGGDASDSRNRASQDKMPRCQVPLNLEIALGTGRSDYVAPLGVYQGASSSNLEPTLEGLDSINAAG